MSVHDAEPNDVYADFDGKLWRVIGTWDEPVVHVEEIEQTCPTTDGSKTRKLGGVSGLMWTGFIRIFRPIKQSV